MNNRRDEQYGREQLGRHNTELGDELRDRDERSFGRDDESRGMNMRGGWTRGDDYRGESTRGSMGSHGTYGREEMRGRDAHAEMRGRDAYGAYGDRAEMRGRDAYGAYGGHTEMRGFGGTYEGMRGYRDDERFGMRGREGYGEDWRGAGGYGEGMRSGGWRGYGYDELVGGGWRGYGYDEHAGVRGREGYGGDWRVEGLGGSMRGGGLTSHRGKGPKGFKRSDERIREMVCEALADHHDIDASEIEVTVKDGEVTLSGTVGERHLKRVAEDVVDEVSGVVEVQNQIRVRREQQQTSGTATTGGNGRNAPQAQQTRSH
ncbi:MAG: BON domain-containing protein [Labilithrix sp.]|nr:BON domain-containing protein [Labilithrix sp.]MCW5809378.1 BON domain-containing protein [Labilithrix sp.]